MTSYYLIMATMLTTIWHFLRLSCAAGTPPPPPPPSPYTTACPPRYIPRIIHGLFDDLVPKQFRYDTSNDAIVVTGYSRDYSLRKDFLVDDDGTAPMYPFVMYLSGPQKTVQWAIALDLDNNSILEVSLSEDGNIIGLFTTDYVYVILDSQGTIISSHTLPGSSPAANANLKNILIRNLPEYEVYIQQTMQLLTSPPTQQILLTPVYSPTLNTRRILQGGGMATLRSAFRSSSSHTSAIPIAMTFNSDQTVIFSVIQADSQNFIISRIKPDSAQMIDPSVYFLYSQSISNTLCVAKYQVFYPWGDNIFVFAFVDRIQSSAMIILGDENPTAPDEMVFTQYYGNGLPANSRLHDIQIAGPEKIYGALYDNAAYSYLVTFDILNSKIILQKNIPAITLSGSNARFKTSGDTTPYFYLSGSSTSYHFNNSDSLLSIPYTGIHLYSTDAQETNQKILTTTSTPLLLSATGTALINMLTSYYAGEELTDMPDAGVTTVDLTNIQNVDLTTNFPAYTPPATLVVSFKICASKTVSLYPYLIGTPCSGFYMLTMKDGSTRPSWILFFDTTYNMIITSGASSGTYNLRLRKINTPTYTEDYFDIQLIGEDLTCLRFTPGYTFPEISVYLNEHAEYTLPSVENAFITPPQLQMFSSQTWVTPQSSLSGLKLMFDPTSIADVGEGQQVMFFLYDGTSSEVYSITVNVRNRAPVIDNGGSMADVEVGVGMRVSVPIPSYSDPEGQSPISLSISPALSFITIEGGNLVILCPQSYAGTTIDVSLILTDTLGASSTYAFKILVQGQLPYLLRAPPNVNMHINENLMVALPPIMNNNDQSIILHEILPQFVTFDRKENIYTLNPTKKQHLGTFTIQISLVSGGNTQEYSFKIKVKNEAPILSEALKDQMIVHGVKSTYDIPRILDSENMQISLSFEAQAASFISLQDTTFTFLSTQERDIGSTTKVKCFYTDNLLQQPLQATFYVTIFADIDSLNAALLLIQGNNSSTSNSNVPQISYKQRVTAGISIREVTRTGLIRVRVKGGNGAGGIAEKIELENMRLRVVWDSQKEKEIIKFNITDKTLNEILLHAQYPQTISKSLERDQLELTIISQIEHEQTSTLTVLKKGTSTLAFVPPQISDTEKDIADAFQQSMGIVAVAAIPGGIVLNFLLSMFIQFMWGLLNDLSFLTILTLLSVSVPGIAQLIQSTLLNFIYLDILKTDQWFIPWMFQRDSQSALAKRRMLQDSDQLDTIEDKGLNDYLDSNGFASTRLIKNLQSTFLYLLALIGLSIFAPPIVYVIKRLRKQVPKSWAEILLPDFIVGLYIRFFIQQFSPLIFSGVINIYDMRVDSESGQSLGTVLTPVILAGLTVGLIASYISILKNRDQLESRTFNQRYNNLIQGLKTKVGSWAPYWTVMILVRWVITALVLIGLRNYGGIQICLMLLISFIVQAQSLGIRPMNDSWENTMIIVNECFVSVYLYVMMALSSGIDGRHEVDTKYYNYRDMCGLALVGVVFLSIFLNFSKLIMVFADLVRIKIKRARLRGIKSRKTDYLMSSQFIINAATLTNTLANTNNNLLKTNEEGPQVIKDVIVTDLIEGEIKQVTKPQQYVRRKPLHKV
ncbi:hypothetical protein FGO68_gene800 [Halteria grandinella]|uniref:TRP C-terminal domain-containing protein n=1 Tax=Halteria grandinella TaxID=5974 RepID=A0A8J8P2W2_HALGN|nr:hypothetical protein FGO68_gene800 [Halteria grandinella]